MREKRKRSQTEVHGVTKREEKEMKDEQINQNTLVDSGCIFFAWEFSKIQVSKMYKNRRSKERAWGKVDREREREIVT